MIHVGAFCAGCTRRVVLARASLMSVKATVMALSQMRVLFHLVAVRSALRVFRVAAQPGMNDYRSLSP